MAPSDGTDVARKYQRLGSGYSRVSALVDRTAFDTVVCTLAGCTFARPDAVFGEIRRLLRPGGQALFLEHVGPANRSGRVALRAIKPLTVAALGCHPDRDTAETIASAAFSTEILDRAILGLFLSVRATPVA